MTRRPDATLPSTRFVLVVAISLAAACRPTPPPAPTWTLAADSAVKTNDAALLARIGRALDAAEHAGTDPSISKFQVRTATVVTSGGEEHVVVGGNTEYAWPEAVHGEVSVVNHVIARFGAGAARTVPFIAFYSQSCGDSRGCGDCRDYLRAATEYAALMFVCGRATDHTIHIRRFSDGLIDEAQFADVTPESIALPRADLDRLLAAARAAQGGGVTLFTAPERQVGAAALTSTGRIYRAAGADDAAFHYRYPVGGVLQQTATTFDAALPHPFSVARFNPEAVERFLTRTGAAPPQ